MSDDRAADDIHGGDFAALRAIMKALRTPGTGCPWDLEQDYATIAPYTIEEAYEVADAVERGDLSDLREELGDLLLQVVFHARMAEEDGAFTLDDVVAGICEKMLRRHPHVFGDVEERSVGAVNGMWERIKAEERAAKASNGAGPAAPPSALDDVPVGMPALTRALKLQKRAARVGFDWPDLAPVLEKLDEETAELREAADGGDPDRMTDELGDVLFVTANIALRLGIDPEAALRHTNEKFSRRFRGVEDRLRADGKTPEQSTLAEMDALWDDVKREE